MEILASKVYVPAKDFAESQRFYRALGFTLTPAFGDTMDCELGGMRFRLQDYYVEAWANNFMFVITVDDARAWFEHAERMRAEFPTIRAQAPEPVGDALVAHIWDPTGVLLVLVQDATR